MVRSCRVGAVILSLTALSSTVLSAAETVTPPDDTRWTLLHEDAVLRELKLTAAQQKAWHAFLDPLDLRLWPLRNQPAKAAIEGTQQIFEEAEAGAAKVLRADQAQRLQQIVLRVRGASGLLHEDVAAKLKLTEKQRGDLKQKLREHAAAEKELREEAAAGKKAIADAERELSRLQAELRDRVVALLTADQKSRWGKLVGADFDSKRLGRTRYRAPLLLGEPADWVNGQPVSPADLEGRVVVVHFFAFGCINCIHNYPSYRKWQEAWAGKNVRLIGIHTPETKGEHDVPRLQEKLKAESLAFPVLVDNEKANWNAWGNQWWPAVYVIDQQGYLRSYWPGELKWQGRDGEAVIESQVAELLAGKQ